MEYTPVTSATATGCVCALQPSPLTTRSEKRSKCLLTWRQLKKKKKKKISAVRSIYWSQGTGFYSGCGKEAEIQLYLAFSSSPPRGTFTDLPSLLSVTPTQCDTKREIKWDTYPPSKILILTGSPLLVTRASSSDFPLLSSSFSALVISFRPSLERSEGKWTYLPKRAKQSLITYKITLRQTQTQKEPATYCTCCSWQLSAAVRTSS